MPGDNASVLAAAADRVRCELTDGWHVIRTRGPNQVQFWLIALAVGIASGFAALFFRKGIEALQELLYRADDITHLHSWAGSLPWYWVLCIPILGGLLVGRRRRGAFRVQQQREVIHRHVFLCPGAGPRVPLST